MRCLRAGRPRSRCSRGNAALALGAAQLWLQARSELGSRTPDGDDAHPARRGNGDLKGDLERVAGRCRGKRQTLGEAFLQLQSRAVGADLTRRPSIRWSTELAKPYPGVAEAQFAIALAGYNTGSHRPRDRGSVDARRSIARSNSSRAGNAPRWSRPTSSPRTRPRARSAYLNAFLAEAPESRAAAGALAQLYVEQKRYAERARSSSACSTREPDDRELDVRGRSALDARCSDYATCRALVRAAQGRRTTASPGAVAFYLAQIAEETRRYDVAIARYREVTEGERAWTAKLRIAAIMGKQGKLDDARRYLADTHARRPRAADRVAQTEAQLLQRRAAIIRARTPCLTRRSAGEPDSADLLYDVAMVAEKLDRLDEVESRLEAADRAQAGQRAGAQRARIHAGRPHAAHGRGHEADRTGACARARRPVHPRQHGLGAFPARQSRRVREVPPPRSRRPTRTLRLRRTWARCSGPRASATRAQDSLAVATQANAGQPGAARNRPPRLAP